MKAKEEKKKKNKLSESKCKLLSSADERKNTAKFRNVNCGSGHSSGSITANKQNKKEKEDKMKTTKISRAKNDVH